VRKIKRISKQTESRIIKGLLRGDSYKKVATQYNVSTSTVHRIVQDQRQKVPDFDDLRHLIALLNRAGLTFYDATRAATLTDRLNNIAVSIEKIEDFHQLMLRISNERDSDAEDLVESSLKLTYLEQQTEKSCQEIVEEFKQASERTQELKEEEKQLRTKIEKFKVELEEIQVQKAETKAELDFLVDGHKKVSSVGLNKISRLAQFILDLEQMGFNVRENVRALKWRKKLREFGIHPEKLDQFLKNKGTLERQIANLRGKKEQLETIISSLVSRKQHLLEENNALEYSNQVYMTKTITTTCRDCWSTLIIPANQEIYRDQIQQNQVITVLCTRCGSWNNFDPREIVYRIGWHILPLTGE
jgi:phage shock protein A